MHLLRGNIRFLNFFDKRLVLIILIGFLLRLIPAFMFEATGDTGGWRLGGRTGLEGIQLGMGNGTVYDGDCPLVCANWTPLSFHYYVAARWGSEHLNPLSLPDQGYYKILSVISDSLVIFGIYLFAKQLKLSKPVLRAGLYAVFPVAIYVSGYHGQRTSIWVCLALFAALFSLKHKYLTAALLYGASLAIKLPAIILFPVIVGSIPRLKNKILFLSLAFITFVALSTPEVVTYTDNVIRQVFFYKGEQSWWGVTGLLEKLHTFWPDISLLSTIILIYKRFYLIPMGLFISLISISRRIELPLKIVGAVMISFLFMPSFAPQYLLWPAPFLFLLPEKYTSYVKWHALFSTHFAMAFYGIFGIPFLEMIFLNWSKEFIFYRINGFIYPQYISYEVWVMSGLFSYLIIRDSLPEKIWRGHEKKR